MPHRIEDWLDGDPSDTDYYRLADLPRFHPDRAALLKAIFAAEQALTTLIEAPAEAPRHDRVRRWLTEIQQATRTFADDQAWQAYDTALRSKLRDVYSIEAAGEAAAWQEHHVRNWLERSQHVSPLRLDEVVAEFLRAVTGGSIEAWEHSPSREGPVPIPPRGVPPPQIRKLPGSAGSLSRRPSSPIQPANARPAPPRVPGAVLPAARPISLLPPGGAGAGRAPAVRRPMPPATRQASDRYAPTAKGSTFFWILGSAMITAVVIGSIGTFFLVMQHRDGVATPAKRPSENAPDEAAADRQLADSRNRSSSTNSADVEPDDAKASLPSTKVEPPDPQVDAAKSTVNEKPVAPGPAEANPDQAPSPAEPKESQVVKTDDELRINRAHPGPIRAIVWNREGTRVSSAGEGPIVRIWNAANGEKLQEIEGTQRAITALAWSADEKSSLAGATDDGSILIWDAEDGSTKHTLSAAGDTVTALMWTTDEGRLAAGDEKGRLSIWDAKAGKRLTAFDEVQGALAFRTLCRFSEGDSPLTAVSGQADGSLIVWGRLGSKPETLQMILPDRGELWAKFVAVPDDENNRNAKSPGRRAPPPQKKRTTPNSLKESVAFKARTMHATPSLNETCLAISAWPHEQLVAVATGDIEIWDLHKRDAGVRVRTLPPADRRHGYCRVAWSAEGDFLAAADDQGLVQVWETRKWTVIISRPYPSAIDALAWKPDAPARLAVASADGMLSILSVAVPKKSATPVPPFDLVEFIATAMNLTTQDEWVEVSRAVALLESYQPLPTNQKPAFEKLQRILENAAQSQLSDRERELEPERPRPGYREPVSRDFVGWFLTWQGIIDLAPDGQAARKARQRLEALATGR